MFGAGGNSCLTFSIADYFKSAIIFLGVKKYGCKNA
jgi:hypothetical protein